MSGPPELAAEGCPVSREIIEAIRTIEREKGIRETRDAARSSLEDALLAAYKKTPERSVRHGRDRFKTPISACSR